MKLFSTNEQALKSVSIQGLLQAISGGVDMPVGNTVPQDELCGYDFPEERIQEIVDSYEYDFPQMKEAALKAVKNFIFPEALVSELHAVARCFASEKHEQFEGTELSTISPLQAPSKAQGKRNGPSKTFGHCFRNLFQRGSR